MARGHLYPFPFPPLATACIAVFSIRARTLARSRSGHSHHHQDPLRGLSYHTLAYHPTPTPLVFSTTLLKAPEENEPQYVLVRALLSQDGQNPTIKTLSHNGAWECEGVGDFCSRENRKESSILLSLCLLAAF